MKCLKFDVSIVVPKRLWNAIPPREYESDQDGRHGYLGRSQFILDELNEAFDRIGEVLIREDLLDEAEVVNLLNFVSIGIGLEEEVELSDEL